MEHVALSLDQRGKLKLGQKLFLSLMSTLQDPRAPYLYTNSDLDTAWTEAGVMRTKLSFATSVRP